MKKVSLLALALSTTLAPTIASAQVVVPTAPVVVGGAPCAAPVAPAPCAVACPCPKAFQGFAFGGNIGYGIGASHLSTGVAPAASAGPNTGTTFNTAYQGVDGGLLVGYTHRFCNWAVGLDFYANWTNASGSAQSYATTGRTVVSDSYKVALQNTLDLRATFGYVINNLVLPKIMLGWENASYKTTANQSASIPGASSRSKTSRLNGFLWGAGVDFLVAKNVVCGLEYTGVTLNKQTLSYTYQPAGATVRDSSTTKIKPSAYNKFAVTLKFVY